MKKELGFIGLGRMGLNMTTRLVEQGYRVVGSDPSEEARSAAAAVGVEVVRDYSEMSAALPGEKVVWVMVPSKYVEAVLEELLPHLNPGDTIIDGGNSFYQDSLRRHKALTEKGLKFLDVGTSGGMEGARSGASIMVGGAAETFAPVEHIFASLATKDGYARVGNAGAGHFVKMTVLHEHQAQFEISLPEVFKPYEHESIIASKLVTWLRTAYDEGQIDAIMGMVPSGETEAEMEHITTIGDVLVLEAALAQRRQTRVQASYLGKLVAAMRNQFGGHKVITKE